MKRTLMALAAALAFAGCSEDDLLNVDNNQIQEENAVSFGTYVGDNAQTRASVIDTDILGVKGFGVNAWYTKAEEYSSTGTFDEFMANTKVTFNPDKGDNGTWTYSPVKYWPNNKFTDNDGNTRFEMVSFFAYGPYAKEPGASNITLNEKGDALTFEVKNEVKEQVDLIYNTNYDGTVNQSKPAVGTKINFKFDHALSRVSFTVEAAVDEATNGDNLLDGNSRINIKKVALVDATTGYVAEAQSQSGPFYSKGTLSLLKPESDDDSVWSETEGNQGFVFNATEHFAHIKQDVDATDKTTTVDVMQLTRFNASEPQPLLNEDSYLMIIPQTDAEFKIYIEYDVITVGEDGTEDASMIANRITSDEALKVTFEKGKAYNFNLVLGMTSVKFEAEVSEWDDDHENYDQEDWLPENTDESEGTNS